MIWTAGQVSAFEEIHAHFGELMYGRKVSGEGLKANMITDAGDTRAITSFIAWTACTGVARRPGKTYSYTNNWPPEELVGNTLTGEAIMWWGPEWPGTSVVRSGRFGEDGLAGQSGQALYEILGVRASFGGFVSDSSHRQV